MFVYHGKPQLEHAYGLLQPLCAKVFVSNRPDQAAAAKNLPQLHDLPQFSGIGPLGGILSAMARHPGASWLVLACDLPFVTSETLKFLIEQRDQSQIATAFMSTHDQLPEPLCAIWEPRAQVAAGELLKSGVQCPRKLFIQFKAKLISQKDHRWLDNVNNPAEYQSAVQGLKNGENMGKIRKIGEK